jgi:tRNA:m4X modification enzyme
MRKRNIRNILCNEGIDEAKLNWTQCCYFIKSKNRFCNIAKSRNSEYCGNHCQAGETGEAGETGAGTREVKKCKLQGVPLTRCPCPVDPSHTVYLHNLNKHIKICNISTQNAQLSKQIYYRENCNSSSEAEDQKCEVITDPILSVDLDRLVDKVRVCFNNIQIQNNSIQVPTNKFIEDTVLSTVAKDQSSFSRLRHAQQDARIIETLIDSNLLWHKSDDPNSCVSKCVNGFARSTVYVELGAGRGMLGLAIHAVSPESTIVLVERSGQRHKAEKSKNINVSPDESDQQQSNSNKLIHRLRMDIRHCLISKLPGIYRDITPIPENDQVGNFLN